MAAVGRGMHYVVTQWVNSSVMYVVCTFGLEDVNALCSRHMHMYAELA